MARVSLLGVGAMGSRMGARLIDQGHPLTVWNRTPERATPLLAAGARMAGSPREAAVGAEFIVSMVRDDAASEAVWLDAQTGALSGMEPLAIAIEASTLSPRGVTQLGRAFAERSRAFLEAPVAGSRPQADAGQLIAFVGGDRAAFDRAEPVIRGWAATIHHAGPVGAGAAVKLAVNTLLGVQVATLAELLAALARSGVTAQAAVELLGSTPVCSPAARVAAASMAASAFDPMFPIELVEKDFGYALDWAATEGSPPLMTAAHSVFAEALRRGLGDRHLTAVARLYADDA